MDDVDQDELRALRHRAYGRDSDIHLDPASLQRLRDLESAAIESTPETPDEIAEVVEGPSEPDPEEEMPRPAARWRVVAIGLGRWVLGLRRSTVLIVVGVAVIAAVLMTALTLIDRVQTDPLQAGATQIGRLSLDGGYDIPEFFSPAGGPDYQATGYQRFHGLRAVVSAIPAYYVAGGNSTCLAIYPEEGVTATADSFSGPLFTGCAAGDFPAIVQFPLEAEDLPEELISAFPQSTGLQFVYDAAHDEVVVFSDQSG